MKQISISFLQKVSPFVMVFLGILVCDVGKGQNTADITSNPSNVNVQVGDTFTLTVQIDPDGTDVSGAQISMSFNNSSIEVTDISSAPGNPLNVVLPGQDYDNTDGTLYFAAYSFNSFTEPFDFLIIECTAIGSGTTLFSFNEGGFLGTRASNEGQNVTDVVTGSVINITAVIFECEDLQVNNGDPCIVGGENGEYVNCECLPFDCAGVPGGASDEQLWYNDSDNDGFGDPDNSVLACNPPSGYVGNNLDCDDSNEDINPNAQEICDGVDNDCDGLIDDEDPDVTGQSVWYADNDGDGFGAGAEILACNQPANTSANNLDCDDSNEDINPNAQEICDGVDNDCDGLIDDEGPDVIGQSVWYADNDGDGFGTGPEILACNQPPNTSDNNLDCDDNNMDINPNAQEVCDGEDNDCDGLVDDDDANLSCNDSSLKVSYPISGNCIDVGGVLFLVDPQTNEPLYTFDIIFNEFGETTVTNLPVGVFDVIVKLDNSLSELFADTELSDDGVAEVIILQLRLGDLNGDDIVNGVDFTILSNAFFTATGETNFNQNADLDCSGIVNGVDFTLLSNNFFAEGDALLLGLIINQ